MYNLTSRPFGRIIRPNGRDEGSQYYECRNFRWLSNDNSNSSSCLIGKTTNIKADATRGCWSRKITLRQYQRLESGERNILTSSFGLACRVIEALDMDASKFYHGDYYLEELKTIEGKRFGDRGKHQFKWRHDAEKRAIWTNLCRKVYICKLDMQSVLW